jgi:hypothetical protein
MEGYIDEVRLERGFLALTKLKFGKHSCYNIHDELDRLPPGSFWWYS